MPKGPQLRVPEGTKLSLAQSEALTKLLPDFELEQYSTKPHYHESYKQRAESLYDAFLFLLEAYPRAKYKHISNDVLKAYIKELKDVHVKGIKPTATLKSMQANLKEFTGKMIDTIALCWGKKATDTSAFSTHEATELLNEAEQYVVMPRGRRTLATLMPLDLKKGEYVLQIDEPLPPYDKGTLAELKQLKALNYPKTPTWFRALTIPQRHYMQAYFCNLNDGVKNLDVDFDALLACWKNARETAEDIATDLKHIVAGGALLPDWFDKLPRHHKALMKLLATNGAETIDAKLNDLRQLIKQGEYKHTLAQIIQLPQWYWVLPEHQQYLLAHVLKSKESVEEAVSFLSSRHRTLPMVPNRAQHSLWLLDSKGDVSQFYEPKQRSSHVATRDGIDLEWPQAVLKQHVLNNLNIVIEGAKADQPVLFQTLISPLSLDDVPIVSAFNLKDPIPDAKLHQMAQWAVTEIMSKGRKVVLINHPYNIANRVLYTVADDKNVLAFLEMVAPYAAKSKDVAELVDAYKNVLNSAPGTATIFDYAGRELFISSLEQVIAITAGIYSYGSCVSGKDRKAIESIHTDAVFLYKKLYGKWPAFSDKPDSKERKNFVSLVAMLFVTRHHQVHAGHNAPGSDALKTPHKYFPSDIAAEIIRLLDSPRCLKNEDVIASNNEVGKISTGSEAITGQPTLAKKTLCKLVVRQLGAERCQKLYTALWEVISPLAAGEASRSWAARFFSREDPYQSKIKEITGVMNSNTGDEVERMTKIFEMILDCSKPDSSAKPSIQFIYKLCGLLVSSTKGLDIEKRADELGASKEPPKPEEKKESKPEEEEKPKLVEAEWGI